MFNRILVPLDGSELSELSLAYAEELAAVLNSGVELVYVCESAEAEYRHMHQLYIEKMAQQVRNHIKAHPLKKGEDQAVSVKWIVLDDEPATVIVDYADNNEVSLIALTSHGRSGILPWPMGSTADKIMHGTSKPVLLIKASIPAVQASKGGMFSRILVPLDGSETGEAALPYVRELVKKLSKVEITLLQVVAPGQHTRTIGGLDYILFSEQQIAATQTEARQYLENASGQLKDTRAKIKCEVKTGHEAQEIAKFAAETKTGLVAISIHGQSGAKRWIYGGITHKILHIISMPILVVKSPATES